LDLQCTLVLVSCEHKMIQGPTCLPTPTLYAATAPSQNHCDGRGAPCGVGELFGEGRFRGGGSDILCLILYALLYPTFFLLYPPPLNTTLCQQGIVMQGGGYEGADGLEPAGPLLGYHPAGVDHRGRGVTHHLLDTPVGQRAGAGRFLGDEKRGPVLQPLREEGGRRRVFLNPANIINWGINFSGVVAMIGNWGSHPLGSHPKNRKSGSKYLWGKIDANKKTRTGKK